MESSPTAGPLENGQFLAKTPTENIVVSQTVAAQVEISFSSSFFSEETSFAQVEESVASVTVEPVYSEDFPVAALAEISFSSQSFSEETSFAQVEESVASVTVDPVYSEDFPSLSIDLVKELSTAASINLGSLEIYGTAQLEGPSSYSEKFDVDPIQNFLTPSYVTENDLAVNKNESISHPVEKSFGFFKDDKSLLESPALVEEIRLPPVSTVEKPVVLLWMKEDSGFAEGENLTDSTAVVSPMPQVNHGNF